MLNEFNTAATGLDHLDFYGAEADQASEILEQEKGVKWTRETNDVIGITIGSRYGLTAVKPN